MKKAERVKKMTDRFAPTVRTASFKDTSTGEGVVHVVLRHGASMPPPLNATKPPTPVTPRCVVSGKKAKYRDPASGLPFRDAAAFRELRRRRDAGELGDDIASGGAMVATDGRGVARTDADDRPGGFPGNPVEAPALAKSGATGPPESPAPAPKPAKRAKKA